ncbi:MAG: extracellular solute-binding protein [Chloroflexi bacterium]|nr:extracellular solute-binding protein [Chloroflexota bacterium]
MPTIKDIAKLAGVSHGTVSNVMNKKGIVSIKKIKQVEDAARALGYQRSAQASQLRQGHNRFVGVIIPDLKETTYVDLFTSLGHYLRKFDYNVNVYFTRNMPHAEEIVLEQVRSLNPDYVVVVSSLVTNDGVYDEKNRFIFVDRFVAKAPKNALFISFDFEKAGFEIGERVIADGHRNIALFCGIQEFSDEKKFQIGLDKALEKSSCTLHVFRGDYALAFSTAFDILSMKEEIDAIVTPNAERVEHLQSAISFIPNRVLPAIYSVSNTDILPIENIVNYELNYKMLGRKIGQYILKSNQKGRVDKNYFQSPHDGFRFRFPRIHVANTNRQVKFLTLASPTSEALRKILSRCSLQTGITVELTELNYDELYRATERMTAGSSYDLIRLDLLWLSDLGRQLFSPLNMDSPELKTIVSEFSLNISSEYFKIGKTVYSLPFDPSVQMLYYRADLFEDVKIKREFYERHRRQLTVPESVEEYCEVARFFTKEYNPNSPTDFGASLVFGAALTAACDYLPWFLAHGGKIFDKHGHVVINTSAAKKALENYIDMLNYTEHTTNMWWRKALENFALGNTAMVSSFSNHASHMVLGQGSQVVGKIGFAAIPGGHPLLGGGVVGISKDSQKYEECLQVLKWIYQANISSIITYLGGNSPCQNVYENEDLQTLYPWIKGIDDGLGIGRRRNEDRRNPRFSDLKFETILGAAVRNVAMGTVDIDTALKEAQGLLDHEFNERH